MKDFRAILPRAALAAILIIGSATIASGHDAAFGGGHGFGGDHFDGAMQSAMHGDGFEGHSFGGFSGPHLGEVPYPEHFNDGYEYRPEHSFGAPFVPRYHNDDDDDYGQTCLAYPSYNPHTGTYVGADGEVYHCP
jgi:BA14K-like protein